MIIDYIILFVRNIECNFVIVNFKCTNLEMEKLILMSGTLSRNSSPDRIIKLDRRYLVGTLREMTSYLPRLYLVKHGGYIVCIVIQK